MAHSVWDDIDNLFCSGFVEGLDTLKSSYPEETQRALIDYAHKLSVGKRCEENIDLDGVASFVVSGVRKGRPLPELTSNLDAVSLHQLTIVLLRSPRLNWVLVGHKLMVTLLPPNHQPSLWVAEFRRACENIGQTGLWKACLLAPVNAPWFASSSPASVLKGLSEVLEREMLLQSGHSASLAALSLPIGLESKQARIQALLLAPSVENVNKALHVASSISIDISHKMDVTCIVEWVVALLLQEPVHHIIVGAQLAHILVPVLNNRLLRVMMELVLRRSAVLPTWIGSRELCDIDEHVDVKCEYMLTKLFVSAALHTQSVDLTKLSIDSARLDHSQRLRVAYLLSAALNAVEPSSQAFEWSTILTIFDQLALLLPGTKPREIVLKLSIAIKILDSGPTKIDTTTPAKQLRRLGMATAVFRHFLTSILLDPGTPMQSDELADITLWSCVNTENHPLLDQLVHGTLLSTIATLAASSLQLLDSPSDNITCLGQLTSELFLCMHLLVSSEPISYLRERFIETIYTNFNVAEPAASPEDHLTRLLAKALPNILHGAALSSVSLFMSALAYSQVKPVLAVVTAVLAQESAGALRTQRSDAHIHLAAGLEIDTVTAGLLIAQALAAPSSVVALNALHNVCMVTPLLLGSSISTVRVVCSLVRCLTSPRSSCQQLCQAALVALRSILASPDPPQDCVLTAARLLRDAAEQTAQLIYDAKTKGKVIHDIDLRLFPELHRVGRSVSDKLRVLGLFSNISHNISMTKIQIQSVRDKIVATVPVRAEGEPLTLKALSRLQPLQSDELIVPPAVSRIQPNVPHKISSKSNAEDDDEESIEGTNALESHVDESAFRAER